jgi:putative ABC transport system permease protein
MSSLADDLRHALRTFRRAPGFTATVVTTLAVGIAAATVIVAVVNAVLWARYDVYREPGRLVYVLESNVQQGANGGVSPRTLADWRASARSFERLGGVEPGSAALVSAGSLPESVMRAAVTEDLFAALDARPAAGRLFGSSEYADSHGAVGMLSHRLWQDRFRADSTCVGRTVQLDGRPLTIVGVLAPEFTLAPFLGANPDVYVPKALLPGSDRSARSLMVVGRLNSGASGSQAQSELDAISATVASADPAGRGWTPWLIQPRAFRMSGDSQFLVVLAVGVGLVLLIVCANVASLLLARSSGRAREIATRIAIGAGRGRIVRQLLTESLLMGAGGAVGGLFVSWAACRGITLWLAGTSLDHLDVALDDRVLGVACGMSLLVALGVGALPALRLARLPVYEALKDGASLWGRMSAGRLRRMMVAGEVAMAVVLLLSAGLVLRGLVNLRQSDPGYRPENLLTLRVTLTEGRYGDAAARGRFVDQALDRLASRQSFRSVAASSLMPAIGGEAPVEAVLPDGGRGRVATTPSAGVLSVSRGYFQAMATPIVLGRAFDATDVAGGLPTAVVSQAFVDRWMEGRDPVGARLLLNGVSRTIVGVAADVHTFHLNVAPQPTVYVPYAQRPVPSFWLVLRSAGSRDPLALATEARRQLAAIDPEQPVRGGEWADALVERSMGGFDLTALLVGVLAVLAAGLAALGIYGVVAFSVARRTREMGVRMALGAAPGQVVRQVMGEAARMALAGTAPGLLMALAAGQLLASKLQRVSPFDPALLGAVCLLVLLTVAAAAWGPAHRAARVDPVSATRTE